MANVVDLTVERSALEGIAARMFAQCKVDVFYQLPPCGIIRVQRADGREFTLAFELNESLLGREQAVELQLRLAAERAELPLLPQ